MIDPLLHARLRPLLRRFQQRRFAVGMAACWLAVALLGAALLGLKGATGWISSWTLPVMLLITAVAGGWTLVRLWRSRPGPRQLARFIERKQPELKGTLLTAVQQDDSAPGGLNFLQQRVVLSAIQASHHGRWRRWLPGWQMAAAQGIHLTALVLLGVVLWSLRAPGTTVRTSLAPRPALEITPGDVELEKDSSLVVLARFGVTAPARADLVIAASGEAERRLPLARSLSDPVFGASIPEVTADLRYRVEYDGRKSRDFRVTVFEHPRLERSDADLVFPSYTKLAPKRVEDTRRVSAVEGSRLDLSLQLNKPVVSARLINRTNALEPITLAVGTNRAVALLQGWALTNSGRYDLLLVDADGRTNKAATTFVLEALPNRTPELKLASPRGDIRPSALEEVLFSGTVWDDFGVPRYGLAYTLAAGETKFVELGAAIPGQDKRPYQHLVRLEALGVRPDDLLSWYVWAEDIGPDGQVRRTQSDMFFAEVRPFDEIFREGEGSEGQGEGQQGTPATRLAELQKQIINATWKLQRRPGSKTAYTADATVVRESQEKALSQAEEERDDPNNGSRSTEWRAVTKAMESAITHLTEASDGPAALAPALVAEQAAYQALLKMQARETSVSRSRNRGQGSGESASQRQLDQLDLKKAEDRYETQRQAQAAPKPEQQEQLQILNRLQELARRQEDLNERLKELQTALQEARTEEEREEARRQLKRLQEEQRDMLADVDELRQRMDRPENQSRMADERRQLDQTREEVQRAAEAAQQGATSQAVTSGTRAQRQLEELRDNLRKESASQFAEDLKQLRSDARELARKQDDLGRKLDGVNEPGRKTLTESPGRQEMVEQLAQQRRQVTNLVERATQISQLAENAEPILSQKLDDTLRKFQQDDSGAVKQFQQDLLERGQLSQKLYDRLKETAGEGGQTLEMTAELLRQGNIAQADRAEQRARTGIQQFQSGVEQAAESVLGDDTEALRRAADQLDTLTSELQREMAQAPGNAPGTAPGPGDPQTEPRPGAGGPGTPGSPATPGGNEPREPGAAGEQPGQSQSQAQGQGPGQTPGSNPGQRDTQAQAQAPGRGQGPGENQGQAPGNPPGQRGEQASAPSSSSQPSTAPGSAPGRGGQQAGGSPSNQTGGSRAGANLDLLSGGGGNDGEAGGPGGPLTGGNFAPWSDRLREVEELVDEPGLRTGVAGARERARLMRQEFRRDRKKPDWAVVRLEVLKPLVEVRQQIAEELARRGSRDALVPIDRDPVPNRYTELVRRYYEELGKDR